MKLQIAISLFFSAKQSTAFFDHPRIQRGKRDCRFTLCISRKNGGELFEEISVQVSEKPFRLATGSVLTGHREKQSRGNSVCWRCHDE